MKTFRLIGMTLLTVIMCATFAACSDDDDEPQGTTDLIGSVWTGTNPHTGYGVEVKVKNDSKCVVTVYEPNSSTIYDQEEAFYIYDEETGTFACEYDGGITGKISGNKMTLTDRYGTYTLTRK